MPSIATGRVRLALFLVVLFAAVNTVNALNKGGDAAVFFEGGRRFLAGEPLYEGSSAAAGFIGPPFQAMSFAPFAAIAAVHPTAAKVAWHLVNVLALVLAIGITTRAWIAVRPEWGLGAAPPSHLVAPAIVAVLLPLQTNFEHQNMNPVLLALFAGAMWHLTLGSATVAGILIGGASALKAFPAVIILYLCVRGRWRAAGAAAATTAALTLVPGLRYTPAMFLDQLSAFLRLGSSGWPLRGNNQSLVAGLDRFTSGFNAEGVRSALESPFAAALFLAVTLLLALTALIVLAGTPSVRRAVPVEVALAITFAVLLSPIAWDHYWTLLFPAFLIVYESGRPELLGSAGRNAFWSAALLTSGLSPLTLGGSTFNRVRELSVSTMAALILFFALLVLLWRTARLVASENNEPRPHRADTVEHGQQRERAMHPADVQQDSAGARNSFGAEEGGRRADERHPGRDEEVAFGMKTVGVHGGVREQAIESLSRQEQQKNDAGEHHQFHPPANAATFQALVLQGLKQS